MQKIIIKNFGAIEYAEIEVKKILVLIGEQASGKSTIAKLIYFFKSLREDLFIQIYKYTDRDLFKKVPEIVYPEDYFFMNDFISTIGKIFYDFFGSISHLPSFEITFYYSVKKNKYLKLSFNNHDQKLDSQFSDSFLNEAFLSIVNQMIKLFENKNLTSTEIQEKLSNDIYDQLAYEQNKIVYAQRISDFLNGLFESNQINSLFIIAGRNATVSYSELFEKYLFANIQSSLEETRIASWQSKEQTIDEILMLKFIEKIIKIKKIFKKFVNFSELIESYKKDNIKIEKLRLITYKINKIMKGEYCIDNRGEKIVFNQETEEYVYLSNASSGQQESIRILQDIFLNILDDVKVLRIIEEPEAHLFPVAQKQLIELLSLMVNHNEDNQLIITTHSPYILTVFNNLLFANRVVEKNPAAEAEVAEIIPKDSWLKADDFSAYSLGNQSVSETTNYCESIFNSEKGTIQQNYLDTVSEILGGDFQTLYSIHARTFARR
jgi:predicted ATPase